jgi:hypothetical protein
MKPRPPRDAVARRPAPRSRRRRRARGLPLSRCADRRQPPEPDAACRADQRRNGDRRVRGPRLVRRSPGGVRGDGHHSEAAPRADAAARPQRRLRPAARQRPRRRGSARRAGRSALRFAKRHTGQGRRARYLADGFAAAARRLSRGGAEAGTAALHAERVSGLRGVGRAYRTLARAATRADRRAYNSARRKVRPVRSASRGRSRGCAPPDTALGDRHTRPSGRPSARHRRPARRPGRAQRTRRATARVGDRSAPSIAWTVSLKAPDGRRQPPARRRRTCVLAPARARTVQARAGL